MKKVVVYSTKEYDIKSFEGFGSKEFQFDFIQEPLDLNTVHYAKGAFAVCIFVNDHATEDVIKELAALGVKGIAIRATGIDQTDIKAAHSYGIHVANVPDYSPYSVAEHTVMLLLSMNRHVIKANARARQFNFSIEGLTGFDVHSKTIGIIGLGKIGAITAKILTGFGAKLIGFDPMPNDNITKATGLEFVPLDELYAKSDIIILQAPLNKNTKYLIQQSSIEKMKKGVMIINTSRGGLIHTQEALDGIKSGKIGFLGLDVYEKEKGVFFFDYSLNPPADPVLQELLSREEVLVTSHMAFLTSNALQDIITTTHKNLSSWNKGEAAPFEL